MTELIDLSGYIEEGQPAMGCQEPVFWVGTTHEESGYWKEQALEPGEEETGSLQRALRAKRQGSDEIHPKDRAILMAEHGPTHIDSLAHIDPTYDETIDEMDLDWFYGPAVGFDVSYLLEDEEYITIEVLERELEENDLEIREGDTITLHTGHRNENYGLSIEKRWDYMHKYIGLDGETTRWLGDQGVKNIGIDAPTIDHAHGSAVGSHPAHDVCAEYPMTNMENLENLEAVAGRRFTICCFPLKLREGTGSPVRPVAILEDE